MKKKAIFPGTFDPFTIGHYSLVKRSLQLVDEVVIAVGINDTKKNYYSLDKRIEMIRALYADVPEITVASYAGLTADFAKETGACCIIRGVRSVNDFEYEKNMADMNRQLAGVETVVLFTEPEYAHISSTIVRELLRFGRDVSPFVPEGMKPE
ncbi:MAG: pantetheine-phosphate adenylyltransferase [Prevotella sp.]|jgi:pantetheine-phosphate adenylyltransferase|nr:pantetheine-phosphate adenylyltransferase [Prevotella sp.]